MSNTPTGACPGISSNPDISGPGVRIALYLQCFLSIVLVRFSPQDAPGAYWSMTSTSIALIISSFATASTGAISLLDAIIVVYLLLLPILVSASGLSEMAAPSNKQNALRSVNSPLLIIANWTRSALTYSFALYVWISAPTFGSGPKECNAATKFIFFGASLPALGSGRYLNLSIWGLLSLLFFYRFMKGFPTIFIATAALFSSTASQALLKPKEPPKDEIHRELVTRTNFASGETGTTNRLYRPRQLFHELLESVVSQILDRLPHGVYSKLIFTWAIGAWAVIMTELELYLNPLQASNNQWTFGQILPMVLTISPLFSLYEYFLSRRSSGDVSKPRLLRFRIKGARGLQRPFCEVDSFSQVMIERLGEDDIQARRAPTAFAVISVDEREQYTTFERIQTHNPNWDESFDIKVSDKSTVEIRVYDRKCIDRRWPAFIGSTTILPFSVLPLPTGTEPDPVTPDEDDTEAAVGLNVELKDICLVHEGVTNPNMSVTISLSTDTRFQPTLPYVPPLMSGPRAERVERRVGMIKWRNKKYGNKKVTTTRVYQL